MKNCNYNKKIRQSIDNIDKIIKKKFDLSIYDNSIIFIPKIQAFSEYSKREKYVIDSIKKMVCYSDLYTWFNFNKKCNAITYNDEEKFEMLKNINSFKEWEHIFDQSMELYCETIKQVLNFCNSTIFHKILRIKSLSEDDIYKIEKINTIFYQDLEEYTVNVDVDYIIDKIVKMINSEHNTKDQILNEATEFISVIGKIDKILYKKIMLELLKRDILVSNFVQIYENNVLSENIKGILAKLQLYENSDIKKYVDKIKFQHLKCLLYSSIFYGENKEEIDATFILKENTKILEKIKVELKDK